MVTVFWGGVSVVQCGLKYFTHLVWICSVHLWPSCTNFQIKATTKKGTFQQVVPLISALCKNWKHSFDNLVKDSVSLQSRINKLESRCASFLSHCVRLANYKVIKSHCFSTNSRSLTFTICTEAVWLISRENNVNAQRRLKWCARYQLCCVTLFYSFTNFCKFTVGLAAATKNPQKWLCTRLGQQQICQQ